MPGPRGGRPSEPTALKVLKGDRKSRINSDEPTPAPDVPVMPEWAAGEDEWAVRWREVWNRTTRQIGAAKYLHGIDQDMLVTYVTAYVDCERLGRALVKGPMLERDPATGGPKSLTIRREWTTALNTSLKLAREFGLTPSARTALKTTLLGEAESAADRSFVDAQFA